MKPPRFFDDVMDAVAHMRTTKNATFHNILVEVQDILRHRSVYIRNIHPLIKQALAFGTDTGLIKRKDGRYIIGLSREDYNIYKKVRSGTSILSSDGSATSVENRSKRKRETSGELMNFKMVITVII